MKKIFKYLGIVLSVALMGTFTACQVEKENESADLGLGIKVFFPTKVVAGQPMTINGSGFSDVREIVFPGDVSVTGFELVSDEMIRVVAPSGISSNGGKISVVSSTDKAESHVPLTLGNTVISGFSKQDGEEIEGGQQLTIYGEDLEFINGVELLDPDGVPLLISDNLFYRKGTSTVIINIPKKVFEGTYIGKLYTYDRREFSLPELTYKPASDGGHWEIVTETVWEGDGSAGAVNWNGTYRFAGEGFETGEEIAIIDAATWARMKSEPFYMKYTAADPSSYQIRVTTGWWSVQWLGADNDIAPWNLAERIIDNGDGTFSIQVDFSEDPAILDVLDEQHLLFTGSGFTPLEIYFEETIWVDGGGGDSGPKQDVFWQNEGAGAVSWNGTYRFALEGHDTNNECIAEFPQDVWDKIKSGKFFLVVEATDPQIRVTNGWWDTQWQSDFQPGNELLTDNGDGTWTLEINIAGDPLADTIDEKHILFTGDRFTPVKLYF